MKFPFETEYVKVSLLETTATILVEWRKPLELEEFQEGLKAFVVLLKQSGVRRALFDMTQRGVIDMEGDSVIFRAILSQAEYDYKSLQFALVMTEQKYQELILSYTPSGKLILPFYINYFTNWAEAQEWLTHGDMAIS